MYKVKNGNKRELNRVPLCLVKFFSSYDIKELEVTCCSRRLVKVVE